MTLKVGQKRRRAQNQKINQQNNNYKNAEREPKHNFVIFNKNDHQESNLEKYSIKLH